MTTALRVIATALGLVMVATIASPAKADDRSTSAVVQRAIEDAPDPAFTPPSVVQNSAASLLTNVPGAEVSLGDDDSVGISLVTSGTTSGTVEGQKATFNNVAPDTDAQVIVDGNTAQLLSVMRTDDAATSQRYAIDVPDGGTVEANGLGGYLIKDSAGDVTGVISTPWAVDAEGKSLPTNYTLDGTTVVQHTDTSGATFPVVADPTVSVGLGVYWAMWGKDWKLLALGVMAVAASGVAVSCTIIDKIPNAIVKTIAMLLCGLGIDNIKDVLDVVVSTYKKIPLDDNGCYQQKIIPLSASVVKVSSSKC